MLTIFTLDAKVVGRGARGLPRPGPLRGPQADRGPAGCRGPAGRDQEAQADGAALRPHRPGDRAHADRPVVRGHDQARRRAARASPSRPSTWWPRARCKFVPENWVNTYNQWMKNIQDWCISRQLWWGHQIPAWYGSNGEIFVARRRSRGARQGHAAGYSGPLTRDPDVLDTWYSSALVPFSTLGWPSRPSSRTCSCPRQRAGHRLRHHLLLGRPDDHDDQALHRQGAVQACLHPRPGARCARQEDEQERRQRARPGRPDRRHRPGPLLDKRTTGLRKPETAPKVRKAPRRSSRRHPRLRRRRAALHLRRAGQRWAAASTSTPSAARATATSATSCGTPPASC
jgi:hypothetical protein